MNWSEYTTGLVCLRDGITFNPCVAACGPERCDGLVSGQLVASLWPRHTRGYVMPYFFADNGTTQAIIRADSIREAEDTASTAWMDAYDAAFTGSISGPCDTHGLRLERDERFEAVRWIKP